MIWTVALSVRIQPRFYLIDRSTHRTIATVTDENEIPPFYEGRYFIHKVTGWERRSEPGDIIDFKPIKQESLWTPNERKEFFIVTIYGTTLEQMQQGIVEPLWDLESYKEYKPKSFDEMEFDIRAGEEEFKQSGREIKRRWDDLSQDQKQENYQIYLEVEERVCSFPQRHLKKRRMRIQPETLSEHGIKPFHFTECFDKMKQRKLSSSDNLKRIAKRDVLLGY